MTSVKWRTILSVILTGGIVAAVRYFGVWNEYASIVAVTAIFAGWMFLLRPRVPEPERDVIQVDVHEPDRSVRYSVMGQRRDNLLIEDYRIHLLRQRCQRFLLLGEPYRWSLNRMRDAGIVTDPDWREFRRIMSSVGLVGGVRKTRPLPDLEGAVSRLDSITLPYPEGALPRITKQRTKQRGDSVLRALEALERAS